MGLFQFKAMTFGLCNAPVTFQRLMENALRGLTFNGCLVYLDDIIVYGSTEEEHLERLANVLHRLQSVGLEIRPNKCQMMRRSVRYLGHFVTQHGMGTDLEKTAAVQEWPRPRCVKEVQQFMGLPSYYRRPEVELGARTGGSLDQAQECPVQPANFVPPAFRPAVPAGRRCKRGRPRRRSFTAEPSAPPGGGIVVY
ncbi:retrovirus-related Pol polyprotein from transposon 17.6 [Trichinella spiralis]|uniref:retrovirus-related Pol polyprotein from transposon 17.6 n=1 Tax=Trichinella spiralis TaxID=6334 RepID=UPI0001EFD1C2|nr:retrovirus-related Pol polyprotein from transposon 17.6 [Trichinella spiralis]